MLRKKKAIWKTCLLVIGALLVFYLVGCDHRGADEEVNEAGNEKLKAEEKEEKLLRYVVKVIQKRKKKASWMI